LTGCNPSTSTSIMPKEEEPDAIKSTARLLTPKERGWTNELENAIQNSDDDFGRLSDFEIACHAILAKDNTELALARIRRLKRFKEVYNIPEQTTVFHAIQILHRFMHAYPGFLQSIGVDAYDRRTLFFRLNCLTSPPPFNHSEEDRFAALYFIFHALQPDLDAVRKGTIFVGDLEGVTRQFFSLDLFNGARSLTKESYPIKVKDFPCLAAPRRLSAVYAICWPFFSSTLRRKYIPVSPLQIKDHFPKELLPKKLGGTMTDTQVRERLEENLKKRFENEEYFRL